MKKILCTGVDGNFGSRAAKILMDKLPKEQLIFTSPNQKLWKNTKQWALMLATLILIILIN